MGYVEQTVWAYLNVKAFSNSRAKRFPPFGSPFYRTKMLNYQLILFVRGDGSDFSSTRRGRLV